MSRSQIEDRIGDETDERVEELLREFFQREMPADLRHLPADVVPASRSASEKPQVVSSCRRQVGVAAAIVSLALSLLVITAGEHSYRHGGRAIETAPPGTGATDDAVVEKSAPTERRTFGPPSDVVPVEERTELQWTSVPGDGADRPGTGTDLPPELSIEIFPLEKEEKKTDDR